MQIVVQLMPGPEPWVRVEHASGWFKLPLFSSLEDLMTGVQQGWLDRRRHHLRAETTVRVPLSQWRMVELEIQQRLRNGEEVTLSEVTEVVNHEVGGAASQP
jgi:hypothetical protein